MLFLFLYILCRRCFQQYLNCKDSLVPTQLKNEWGEIIKFPEKYYARRDVDYQKILKDSLNIGQIDFNVYNEGIGLLTPKQLTLYYGVIGANIINVIEYEDFLITIDAIGESDTGKSFTVDMTLAMDYGIFRAKMQDDALMKAFRHHAIAGATNLPIYIEEALLDEKSLSTEI